MLPRGSCLTRNPKFLVIRSPKPLSLELKFAHQWHIYVAGQLSSLENDALPKTQNSQNSSSSLLMLLRFGGCCTTSLLVLRRTAHTSFFEVALSLQAAAEPSVIEDVSTKSSTASPARYAMDNLADPFPHLSDSVEVSLCTCCM